jgi:hypothetical protein
LRPFVIVKKDYFQNERTAVVLKDFVNLYLERLWGEWFVGSPPELGLPGILKMEC